MCVWGGKGGGGGGGGMRTGAGPLPSSGKLGSRLKDPDDLGVGNLQRSRARQSSRLSA